MRKQFQGPGAQESVPSLSPFLTPRITLPNLTGFWHDPVWAAPNCLCKEQCRRGAFSSQGFAAERVLLTSSSGKANRNEESFWRLCVPRINNVTSFGFKQSADGGSPNLGCKVMSAGVDATAVAPACAVLCCTCSIMEGDGQLLKRHSGAALR